MHTGIIDSGLNVNMKNSPSIDRDSSILEYCRLNDITIQACLHINMDSLKELL